VVPTASGEASDQLLPFHVNAIGSIADVGVENVPTAAQKVDVGQATDVRSADSPNVGVGRLVSDQLVPSQRSMKPLLKPPPKMSPTAMQFDRLEQATPPRRSSRGLGFGAALIDQLAPFHISMRTCSPGMPGSIFPTATQKLIPAQLMLLISLMLPPTSGLD
jgi:hypothetical protein